MSNAWAPGSHAVQFYENEPFIHHTIAEFFAHSPQSGDALILVSRRGTYDSVAERLKSGNYGAPESRADNILFVDAEEALSQIVDGETLDAKRAEARFADMFVQAGPSEPHGAIRLYGEAVDIMCQRGRHTTALALEGLASVLLATKPRLSIFCSYAMERFREDADSAQFRAVCRSHSHILPSETFSNAMRVHYREATTLRHREMDRMRDVEAQRQLAMSEGMAHAQHVYVVDDDAGVRRSLERLLNVSNGKVTSFGSAEAFLAALEKLPRGCVLLDIELPGMDGLDLLQRLTVTHASWPVIVMSGRQDKGAESEALRRGARVFLRKPFDSQGLFEAIAQALS